MRLLDTFVIRVISITSFAFIILLSMFYSMLLAQDFGSTCFGRQVGLAFPGNRWFAFLWLFPTGVVCTLKSHRSLTLCHGGIGWYALRKAYYNIASDMQHEWEPCWGRRVWLTFIPSGWRVRSAGFSCYIFGLLLLVLYSKWGRMQKMWIIERVCNVFLRNWKLF